MRILLTGANGMVGRNVLEHARAERHEVLAPSSAELDLRDGAALRRYLGMNQPDLIIHAAGRVGGIQANIAEPVRFFLENLDMGRNVVGAAYEVGVPRLLNIASSCMYPRNASNPLREEFVLQGELEPTNEGYALAKIAATRLCDYVSRERPDLLYRTLIPCNIYGRHDNFDPARSHLVPAVLHKLHRAVVNGEQEVEIWGDGTARREFMFAGDVADCIWRAAESMETLEPMLNVGLGEDRTINEYYEIAARVVGFEGRFVHDLSKPVGMARKVVDVTRLRAWGWTARTSLDNGLRAAYEYYRENFQRWQT